MFGTRFAFAPLLLTLVTAPAGLSTAAPAEQPIFGWQQDRQLDGRSQHIVVPHDPKWLLEQGVVVLDFTAHRIKGAQGLISKDANGNLDGGHLVIWLDEGTVVARMQDRKSEYIVQSPAKTVKRDVPTRVALAFGPGGMKLYVDGKMVANNTYQGGLQGNQEPLVIGARDWKSGPRAADHLDAFFAGGIGALALYGRALDAPAIAALGPAGTALAQAATPATGGQQPATSGVAVATPAQPLEAPVELKIPPASIGTGTQQSQQVPVDLGATTTIQGQLNVENLGTQVEGLVTPKQMPVPQELGGPIRQIPPEEAAALNAFRQRAQKAAASEDTDEQRAALFVELVKAAFKPGKSDQELWALEWWARILKEKRIQAAEGAKQAYADWAAGKTAPRASRIEVMLGDDKVNPPSFEALLASGFERVSGPGSAAADKSWPIVKKRLEAAKVELQNIPGGGTDVLAIIDGVVQTLGMLEGGFTIWTAAAGSAYSIASARWRQIQEAQDLPGKLEGFLSFAKATTPSLTENLYSEDGAKFAYVTLIETTP
jgi:hypothetical protein